MSKMLLKRSFLSSSPNISILIFRFCHTQTQISKPPINPIIFNYLINTLNFPKPKALIVSNRLISYSKTLKTPQNVVNYFQSLGFSDIQIQHSIINSPQILYSHVENTLKPKIKLFQDFGISGVQLSKFLSKHSFLLTYSLNKRLKPCIDAINDILVIGNRKENGVELCRIMSRCNWLFARNPEVGLFANISYLKSCGIDGSQLAMLLITKPRIFTLLEPKIKNLVARAIDMGVSVDSRMLVHALHTVSSISKDTFMKKYGIFKEFGFSEIECMHMFKTTPGLLKSSEVKIRVGLEFFLNTLEAKRSMIVKTPNSLKFSMQDRVIPRYRVVKVMKEKGIMKQELRSLSLFCLPEKNFLMRYILRYSDHSEELLIAYKGHISKSSEE